MTPPLRFLLLVIGGWVAARATVLFFDAAPVAASKPAWAQESVSPVAPRTYRSFAAAATASAGPLRKVAGLPYPIAASMKRLRKVRIIPVQRRIAREPGTAFSSPGSAASLASLQPSVAMITVPIVVDTSQPRAPTFAVAAPPAFDRPGIAPRANAGRLSGSAWMLARGGGGIAVANNGVLGASQAGARMLYRVNDAPAVPLSLSARWSSPLRSAGVEAAVGAEWQPVARLPVRLLAERRQRVSGNGRSAFALLAHGGVGDVPVAAGFTLDAYAQAGIVGARSRDLFADGGATLVRPVTGSVAAGVGMWGGVQPGAARLDVGPRLTTVIDAAGGRARVSIDWRFRVVGDAAPASGPSLTIATGF